MAGYGLVDAPVIQRLAVPAVTFLIFFLALSSQLLFHYASTLQPGPPSQSETVIVNSFLAIICTTYYRAVAVDPGRYVFPETVMEVPEGGGAAGGAHGRWCRKCVAPKPPRAHHCRYCARCIPRMDHHCPWTANCVSMTSFPHFIRFLVWTNLGLWYLGHLLWQRFYILWRERHLPAYLGPSLPALALLSIVSIVNIFTCIALGIILATTLRGWVLNRTMIEGWEADRHEALASRSGRDFWDVAGPNGKKIRFERTEFPYDIGFFANMAQAMGTSNVFLWFFPFAAGPKVDALGGAGFTWPENGFNRKEGMWPPPDPDKIRQAAREWPAAKRDYSEELRELEMCPEEQKAAFAKRQEADLRRRKLLVSELEEMEGYEFVEGGEGHEDSGDEYESEIEEDSGDGKSLNKGADGKPGWTNSDGERLRDYGVDEDAEDGVDLADDDDEVPLAELLRRRQGFRTGVEE